METISVCIPVYNAAPFIKATISSIQAQDWPDLRILVQDNASNDGTVDILRGMAEHDSRIDLRVNMENIGYCGNIRAVVERAATDIVSVFHGDDIYLPGLVRAEYEALKGSGAAAAFSSYRQFFGNPKKAIPYAVGPDFPPGTLWFAGGLDEYLPILLERGNPFACPSFLTYREILLSLGAFTDRYPSNEDLDLWIRYLKAGHKLAIVKERLFLYRRSAGQGSAYWDNRDELPVYFDLIDEELRSHRDVGEESHAGYLKLKAKALITAALNAKKAGRLGKAAAFMRESFQSRRMLLRDGPWFFFQRGLCLFAAYKGIKGLVKKVISRIP